ncbi:MAG: ABC transporter substrate-binding protein [Chloroflexota bacterium]|nr:ABC transporter substrate-binding protein [Chloroflexota bacterium]
MTPRPRPLPLLAMLAALVLSACAPSASPDQSPASLAPAFPLTLTDTAGRTVTIPAEPRRIVSLAPSNTEIVCALDACDRLVGVTDFDDYPSQVTDIPRVVIAAQVDLEKVVAAEPDLVLAAGNELTPSSVIDGLAELGLPVLVLYPSTLEEVYEEIHLVGAAIGARAAAETVVAAMLERADAVARAVAGAPAPRVFYEVGVFAGTIYTAGEDSFLASLVAAAGGEPITGDPLSTSISLEQLIAADPELILLGDAAYDPSITPASVALRPGWHVMSAVHDGSIRIMLDDLVITRPGPRIIDGLEALARAIHPDRFDPI